MTTSDLVLGIDAGTGSLRACVFSLAGALIAGADQPYETSYPRAGRAVQRPADWWNALVHAVRGVLTAPGVDARRIVGLSIDAPCNILLAGADGLPLTDGLLWMDLRGTEYARTLTAVNDPVLRYAGGEVAAEWPWPKACWLKEHDAPTWRRAPHLVEQMTWLTWRLTGEWVQPLNSAAAKWQYRRAGPGWPAGLLDAVNMRDAVEKLPAQVVEMGGVGGRVSISAAAETGLPAGIPVAMSGIDAHAGMIGVNALAPGTLALITGTSTCQLAQSSQPVFDPGLWGPFEDAVLAGAWTIEAGQASTGGTVRWLMDLAGDRWSGDDRYRTADAAALAAGPGAEGLTVLDYWQGSRTPVRDAQARGTITGLTTGHGAGHLLRAVYEATAYGNRRILDTLSAGGIKTEHIIACGGGIRSELWLQILADVAEVPLATTSSNDAVALGTAICAAVGAGAFPNLAAGAAAMVKPDRVVEPDGRRFSFYREGYERYKKTYEALAPLFAKPLRAPDLTNA